MKLYDFPGLLLIYAALLIGLAAVQDVSGFEGSPADAVKYPASAEKCPEGDASDMSALLQDRVGVVTKLTAPTGYQDERKSHYNPAVLGMACTFRKKQMAAFLTSLRSTGYAGSVVLGTDNALDIDAPGDPEILETQQFLRIHRVITRSAPCIEQQSLPKAQRFSVPNGAEIHDLHFRRYHYYAKWIREENYTHAWLVDVKDIFFQADPFSIPTPALSAFNFVADPLPFPNFASSQLKVCFGSDEWSSMIDAGASLLCGGMIVGHSMPLLKLCDDMGKLHVRLKSVPHCDVTHDQPGLNMLLFSYGKDVTRHAFGEGQALSTWVGAGWDKERLLCDSIQWKLGGDSMDRKVVNNAGQIIPVLHMWGTCPNIELYVNAWMRSRGFSKLNNYLFEASA